MPTLSRLKGPLALGSVLLLLTACGKEQHTMGPMGPAEVGVVTLSAKPYTLTTELTGRITAFQVSEVRPQVGGIIKKRLFEEGSTVQAGQPLYQIDPATYKAAAAEAEANLKSAQAQVVATRAKAERYRELVRVRGVSQQDYDDVVATLGQQEAAVASAKAALETARINLGYTEVNAPISGRIGRSRFTEGALVTAGQADMLTNITDLSKVYVDLTQSAEEISALRRQIANGQLAMPEGGKLRVTLLMPDGSEYAEAGTLDFYEVTVDQTTGMVTLRATFPNPRQELLPGMFVRARVEQGVMADAILAPQVGIQRVAGGAAIAMVVGADNKVQMRPVEARQAIGDQWLVTKGLAANERIITEGVMKAAPGAEVKPVPAGQKPAAPAAGAAPQGQAH
ncbi:MULTISPECIES: efflux RND transporter periplasmic adaptor subunit [unclassified Azospirillum]|uniref:efflux RND transporter periplasmic adaptor subunit n=1 Tax=unclassified Azospirillum TaxID=2630922 RepID=UPI000B6B569B|nr:MULTISPECIES: efflux RND transporter periplasmic adaptor subunit [unclassified Azospirillum]SNS84749.1 membrane fusion protein, multidrug efflux system [Azospirillum sp. RU38E]SNT02102.1 membrane fusion protein, multidrug efflux system [Azospirillum sp. RU37A]